MPLRKVEEGCPNLLLTSFTILINLQVRCTTGVLTVVEVVLVPREVVAYFHHLHQIMVIIHQTLLCPRICGTRWAARIGKVHSFLSDLWRHLTLVEVIDYRICRVCCAAFFVSKISTMKMISIGYPR
jgi:hypothetical protein